MSWECVAHNMENWSSSSLGDTVHGLLYQMLHYGMYSGKSKKVGKSSRSSEGSSHCNDYARSKANTGYQTLKCPCLTYGTFC